MSAKPVRKVDDESDVIEREFSGDSIDWIQRSWDGLFPGREGFSLQMAQLTRIGHGLHGIEMLLEADRSGDLGGEVEIIYQPLNHLIVEDLRIARWALIASLQDTVEQMRVSLGERPIERIVTAGRCSS